MNRADREKNVIEFLCRLLNDTQTTAGPIVTPDNFRFVRADAIAEAFSAVRDLPMNDVSDDPILTVLDDLAEAMQ